MPLVLGIDLGHRFYVGDNLAEGHKSKGVIEVVSIKSTRRFLVEVCSAAGTRRYEVGDTEAVQVLPDVFLSCGRRGTLDMARVLVEAPREIKVRREGVSLHG